MKRQGDCLIFSPQDLIQYSESEFASWMDRYACDRPELRAQKGDEPDGMMQALVQLGNEHEQRYLLRLQELEADIITISRQDADPLDATMSAMKEGHDYIYQAALQNESLFGFADFLVKVAQPSELGDWSYLPLECKLALNPNPKYVLQCACYCELLESIQGYLPSEYQLLGGSGDILRFRTEDSIHYYRHTRDRLFEFIDAFDPDKQPMPSPGEHGIWTSHAEELLLKRDHLYRVANITRSQIKKLEAAGIDTVQKLAECPEQTSVERLDRSTFQRLQRQASLQQRSQSAREPFYEVIKPPATDPQRGLALLPLPSALDIYFDIEGYPLARGGLEYLWGVTYEENGQLQFKDWWAHDSAMEKQAFEDFVDWVYDRWQRDPSMHVYHYAPYEVTALKRLMGKYATREHEVDNLLRGEVLVDLYKVVRQGLQVGEESYSIKKLERFYWTQREGDVTKATDSVVQYFQWLQQPDGDTPETSTILRNIRAYNKDDCDSTKALTDWLRSLQITSNIPYIPSGSDPSELLSTEKDDDPTARLAEALLNQVPSSNSQEYWKGASHADLSWRSHELLAHLLQFHRREEKPFWWQRFAWREMEVRELYHELDCLAGLQRTSRAPYKPTPRSRSLAYEYSFDPNQDTKLRPKTSCWLVPSEDGMKGTVAELDAERGHVVITVTTKKLEAIREEHPHWEPPEQTSLVPYDLVKADKLANAIYETVSEWQSSQTLQPALRDLLERRVPRFHDRRQGAIITDSNQLLSQTVEAIAQLDSSVLCIQGPPGSGKTFTASHAILNLLKQGKRVAVTSNSHKAIANLLKRTLELARAEGIDVPAVKKESSSGEPELKEWLELTKKTGDLSNPEYLLAGATAFAFCDPSAQGQWDYLFVDEAGQVSLANLVAIARCSHNIVLIGDQMQLEQPIQGSHPGESGQSALTYLLQDNSTIPPEMGIFLGVSYRMHPNICQFISESVYDNRLLADSGTQLHRLDAEQWNEQTSQIPTSGIHFIPVHHEGNSQSSDEEVSVIRHLIEQLLTMTAVCKRGNRCERMTSNDILVVAPYNMQVRKLESALDGKARVGTVDKFQGQEAPVVILSMCASSCDEVPRGLEFLLSPNRINVALTRAECLSIVVGNPALALSSCASIEQVKLLNLYCKMLAQQQR